MGDYFQTGHYVVIRAKAEMGDYCTVCNHSTIEGVLTAGKGVRIMAHVYIPTRTRIGNHVFIGPGVTFLNDKYPCRVKTPTTPVSATIEDEVSIGGGCTILPGIRIGAHSFIAAGAVVTKDIPPRSFVVGVPGRIQPLPEKFDMLNTREYIFQSIDLWHPLTPDLSKITWPSDGEPLTSRRKDRGVPRWACSDWTSSPKKTKNASIRPRSIRRMPPGLDHAIVHLSSDNYSDWTKPSEFVRFHYPTTSAKPLFLEPQSVAAEAVGPWTA